MAVKTRSKTPRETWRDWLPGSMPDPEHLYTREEIVDLIEAQSKPEPSIAASDLRFWEYRRILPHGVRRTLDGKSRMVYPQIYAFLAVMVRTFQETGVPLQDIPPLLREILMGSLSAAEGHGDHVPGPHIEISHNALPTELVSMLNPISKLNEAVTGSPTTRIEIRLFNKADQERRYWWGEPPPKSDPSNQNGA